MIDVESAVEQISRLTAVPIILQVVCRTTGMGFAAVARVTDERWVACSVLDQISFGLKPGGELKVETTICHEILKSHKPVVINHVAQEPAWREHHTPAMYGFQSYISVPIILSDGYFYGTLCAIDPRPAEVNDPNTMGMFQLFAGLIAKHLDADRKLTVAESELVEVRAEAELREQFIAVLGHDLRTPMRAITVLSQLLQQTRLNDSVAEMVSVIRQSAARMTGLIDSLLDLARGRMGGGVPLNRSIRQSLEPELISVIVEIKTAHPQRVIETVFRLTEPVFCDAQRIAQLFSNLLSNALTYGLSDRPVRVEAFSEGGTFELSVANACDPIPPETMKRLFQPFYRSATRTDREGLGLGLYIASEIARAHDGTLAVQSTADETRFILRIPKGEEALASPSF